MKMTTIMTVVAAMGSLSFAADAVDTTLTAADTSTHAPADATIMSTTPASPTKDCGMLGWLNIDTVTADAANGNPVAQFTVAYLTDTGKADMTQDTEKARELYAAARPGLEQAAADGNAHACRALAHMYAEGKGVEKDADKAAHYRAMCEKCCKDAADKCRPDGKKGECRDGDAKKM